jgi:hypothetical protein
MGFVKPAAIAIWLIVTMAYVSAIISGASFALVRSRAESPITARVTNHPLMPLTLVCRPTAGPSA